jgi:hypothetical protein
LGFSFPLSGFHKSFQFFGRQLQCDFILFYCGQHAIFAKMAGGVIAASHREKRAWNLMQKVADAGEHHH